MPGAPGEPTAMSVRDVNCSGATPAPHRENTDTLRQGDQWRPLLKRWRECRLHRSPHGRAPLQECTRVRIIVVAVVVLLAVGTDVVTVDSAPKLVSAADARTDDGLLAQSDASVPGAAIAVIHNGRLAFGLTYGLANLETNTRVTERTNFRLASLTKAFTAMAVMLLIGDGQLTIDTRVADIIPDFPAYGREIRIRHLLTHTSGLQAYEDFIPKSATHLNDDDVIKLLKRTNRLLFRPGTAFRYGDSGYAVLAIVVETVSGRPFAAFLRDRIFVPLGMRSTIAWTPGSTVRD